MKVDDYDNKYAHFSRRIERAILFLIVCFSVALVTGEMLYAWEPVRQFLVETARLEGIPE